MSENVYFSPSTLGAYTREMHGSEMPDDVVEVTASAWQALLDDLGSSPKKMAARADGYPELIDPPSMTLEQLETLERAWRDAQLSRTDAMVLRHRDEVENRPETTLTQTQYAELQAHRQALREWPQLETFPKNKSRPTPPGWLAALAS
jgi:hypothetical protein